MATKDNEQEVTPPTETVETPAETPVTETATETTVSKEEFEKVQKALKEANKEAAERRKKLEAFEAKEKERADAELTETERLRKQAEAAAAENAQLKTTIMRQEVIAQTGLPAIFTDRLKGATKEEMLADAEELVKTLPTVKVAPKVNATNPASATQKETAEQTRERLFGPSRNNPFDIEAVKRAGGGVIFEPEVKVGKT